MKTMTARLRWRMYWRALRIAQKAAWQVAHDAALYGVGAVQFCPDGTVRRIDPTKILVNDSLSPDGRHEPKPQ